MTAIATVTASTNIIITIATTAVIAAATMIAMIVVHLPDHNHVDTNLTFTEIDEKRFPTNLSSGTFFINSKVFYSGMVYPLDIDRNRIYSCYCPGPLDKGFLVLRLRSPNKFPYCGPP